MKIELLWFDGCPNHEAARELLEQVLAEFGRPALITPIDGSDRLVAEVVRFPGSPTIRVDGADIEPEFVDPEDYTPRCRVYLTPDGIVGVPQRAWIESAIVRSKEREAHHTL